MNARIDVLCLFPNNRPRAYGTLGRDVAAITPPLQAALLAAYVRGAGFSVAVLDADAEDLSSEQTVERVLSAGPRLVCVSTDALNSGDVTKMAAATDTTLALKARLPQTPVVLEGVVPSAFPERVLAETAADFVVRGEPFETLALLLGELRRGRPRPVRAIPGLWFGEGGSIVGGETPALVASLDGLPMAAWDLLPMRLYRAHHWHCFDRLDRRRPYGSVYTNLGCPYECTFCNVNALYGGPTFRTRSAESVLQEIDLLVTAHGVRNLRIVDNVFTIRRDLVGDLCERLARRGHDLNIWAYARVETVDLALLRTMRRAGVTWLAYGIEAASAKVRQGAAKPSSQRAIERAIEATRSAGINIVGNFMFGLPDDTMESMAATLRMAKEYTFEHANFYAAMAYPGTALHESARRAGIPLPESWSGYGQYSEDALPMGSAHVSAADVLRFRDEAFLEYFTYPPYLALLEAKFGPPAVAFTREVVGHKIRRRLLEAPRG
jgi:radical SAM superfamily enzyme YgiQ (UPF0313 family)